MAHFFLSFSFSSSPQLSGYGIRPANGILTPINSFLSTKTRRELKAYLALLTTTELRITAAFSDTCKAVVIGGKITATQ